MERETNRVDHVTPDVRRVRGHPPHVNAGLDPLVERGKQERAVSTDRQADTPHPPSIDFGPACEIVERPEVIPQYDTRPRDARRHQRACDQLLVLTRSPVERGHVVRRHPPRLPIRRRIAVQQHSALAPIEHVDGNDDIASTYQLVGDARPFIQAALVCRERRGFVLDRDDLLLSPDVRASVTVQHDESWRRQ